MDSKFGKQTAQYINMHNFEEILLLDDSAFKNSLSEIDSADIVYFLKNCDTSIKNKYYKRINNILGGNYLSALKIAVNDKGINTAFNL